MDLGLTLYSQKEATVTSPHFLLKDLRSFANHPLPDSLIDLFSVELQQSGKNSPRKQKNNKLGGKKYYFLISRFDYLHNQTQFFKKVFQVSKK